MTAIDTHPLAADPAVVIAEQAAAATAVLAACVTLLMIAWPLAIAVVIGTLVQAFVVNAVSGGLRR
ncbi:hypothetical protein, partial [Microbacterium sp.]|uniref:hypothetical protein n=1 Tax=Microbacterium sp. TaxID=51671 RepID=UPI0028A2349D